MHSLTHTLYPILAIISFHLGVDGISVAMILLTAFVVIAGVLVSWNVEKMTKEFYLLLILLSLGAYGFFISLDLFILFFFLEIAVIPKYLLIGIWGSGKKEYAANKLALMLMGGSALVLVGLLGLYFGGTENTFDLLLLSKMQIPVLVQKICFPLLFVGFWLFGGVGLFGGIGSFGGVGLFGGLGLFGGVGLFGGLIIVLLLVLFVV